ncbi:Hypothetical protein LLA12_01607 [Lactococcus lactis subsp. lactis]|nr:Hypothetical protein LLA12_01607 [Lactococcus lactis subsp. lactis]
MSKTKKLNTWYIYD